MKNWGERLEESLRAHPRKCQIYLFLLALGVFLLYLTQYAASPFFLVPRLDALYHHLQAQALAAGKSPAEPYFRAPLYLWLLGGVYATLGSDPWMPRLVQALLGASSVVLLYRLGERLYRPAVAAVAALSMALYGPLVYHSLELHTPVVEVFCTLAALTVLVRQGESLRGAALAGLLTGLAALARPNALVLLLVGGLYLWQKNRRARLPSLFLLLALLPPLAVTARNLAVAGDAVFIASQGGINLYLGNRPDADGFTPSTPTRYRFDSAYEDSVALYGQRAAEEAQGRALRPSEVSRYWTGKALLWWREEPLAALALTVKKAVLTLSATEVRNNTSFDYIRQHWGSWLWLAPLGFGWAGTLGLVGLLEALRSHPKRAEIQLLGGFLGLYFLSVAVFFAADRLRLPLVPVLLLFAVEGLRVLLAPGPMRRRYILVLVGALLLVCVDWFRLPRRRWESLDTWSAGSRLLALRRPAEAEPYLRRAQALDPQNPDFWASLGEAHYLQDKREPALEAFEQAIRLAPTLPQNYYNAAQCQLELGRREQARALLTEALRHDPGYERARSALAAISSAGR